MELKISCETYVRMAKALKHKEGETREHLRSVLIDIRNGTIVAVASDAQLMIIEHIAKGTSIATSSHHLTIDPVLVEACEREVAFSSDIHIVYNEMLGFASARTTFGYNYPGNAFMQFPQDNDLRKWRDVLPEEQTTSSGAMMFTADTFARIAASSPSGEVVFPEHVDALAAVFVRDRNDENWLGIFCPHMAKDGEVVQPPSVKLPTWIVL